MVSVEEAQAIVQSHPFKFTTSSVPFQDAVGRVLAERIIADRDFPPFDRVSMDGVAILFDQWKEGRKEFVVEGVQPAGMKQITLSRGDRCIEVMTGAMLPLGTDTVIRYEDVEIKDRVARINVTEVSRGQNVHARAVDRKAWSVLLEPGVVLSPAEIAVLASVGKSSVEVFDFPATALVSNGDELVDVGATPEPHQIRRSNTYALQAAMHSANWRALCFHLPDDLDLMREAVSGILDQHQVVILSGGVSKGKYDYVPEVLSSNGVVKHFQGVRQRPGKPFWFGTSERGHVVFALPGNPVSTFLCFHRYIKPWLLSSVGVRLEEITAVLAQDFSHGANLTYFLPVIIRHEAGRLAAYPMPGSGSGDFANLKDVDGFLEIPQESKSARAGEVFNFISSRS